MGSAKGFTVVTISDELVKEFKRVAKRVLTLEWGSSIPADAAEDAAHELVVQYLEWPSFRESLASCENARHRAVIIRKMVDRIYSEMQDGSLVANNQVLYSTDSVKAALKDASTNKQLLDLMPEAMARLRDRHTPYAEAIVKRYGEGIVPAPGHDRDALKNAHKVLTDEVNRASRRLGETRNGPSLRNAVPAEERKGKGATSDPTATMAMAVMSSDEVRDAFYESDPLPVTHGVISEPSPNPVWNIFDHEFQGMPRLDNYRASVFPELYPNEKADYVAEEV